MVLFLKLRNNETKYIDNLISLAKNIPKKIKLFTQFEVNLH